LHALNYSVTAGHELKLRSVWQHSPQSVDANPMASSRNLHHRPVWTPVQTDNSRCPNQSLIAHHTHLDSFAFLHRHHHRHETAIGKVDEFQFFARLVQACMVWQLHKG
jgi:hypothetical protein